MIQQMKHFIAVVQKQSYTKAAAECHTSQSSISEQFKSLANKLGVQLIQRKGRPVTCSTTEIEESRLLVKPRCVQTAWTHRGFVFFNWRGRTTTTFAK